MPFTVLIVDDHDDSREMYAHYLSCAAGFDVCTAASAEEALRLAHEVRPAVMLVDVRLPGASGFDLTQQLREDERTRNMAILLLTGDIDAPDRSTEVGADGCLLKPFPPDALVGEILAALDVRRTPGGFAG